MILKIKSMTQWYPSYLFKDSESKPIVLIDVPLCNKNEKVSKKLLRKLNSLTKEKYDF